jgi:hypothetical protein
VIKGRWTAGSKYAYFYARDVIKGPFPEAEPAILKNIHKVVDYVQFVRKSRWPEFERRYANNHSIMWQYKRAINLFNLHSEPEKLNDFDKSEEISELAWQRKANAKDSQNLS